MQRGGCLRARVLVEHSAINVQQDLSAISPLRTPRRGEAWVSGRSSMFQRMNHPSEGELRYISPAARYQATPAAVRLPGPRLSQHTDELLTSVGYFAKRIATLRSAGVIA